MAEFVGQNVVSAFRIIEKNNKFNCLYFVCQNQHLAYNKTQHQVDNSAITYLYSRDLILVIKVEHRSTQSLGRLGFLEPFIGDNM